MAAAWDVPADGAPLATEQDALDLIGASYGSGSEVMVIPAERFAPEFWQLRTGIAGAFIQKLVTYGFRVAVVGDISAHLDASQALRDFVTESNRRGRELRFVADRSAIN